MWKWFSFHCRLFWSLCTFSHLVLNQPAHIYMGDIFWTHSHTNTPARRQWHNNDNNSMHCAHCSLLIYTKHPLICSNLIRLYPNGNCNRSCVEMSSILHTFKLTFSKFIVQTLFSHAHFSRVFLVLFCMSHEWHIFWIGYVLSKNFDLNCLNRC